MEVDGDCHGSFSRIDRHMGQCRLFCILILKAATSIKFPNYKPDSNQEEVKNGKGEF